MKYFILLIQAFAILGCNKSEKASIGIDLTLDYVKYTVLKFDTSYHWIFGENCKESTLTNNDILICEKIINELVHEYNKAEVKKLEEVFQNLSEKSVHRFNKGEILSESTIKLKNYYRQYMTAILPSGEKIVYINLFCDGEHDYWKKEMVYVFDGGNCYFNLKVNLTTGLGYEFSVNGDG